MRALRTAETMSTPNSLTAAAAFALVCKNTICDMISKQSDADTQSNRRKRKRRGIHTRKSTQAQADVELAKDNSKDFEVEVQMRADIDQVAGLMGDSARRGGARKPRDGG